MTAFVVVGAGLTGAATAWQLARRGHEVTVLERSAPANAQGSSHGSARILRYGYPDPFYARLVVEARAEWDELERLGGERLITPTGSLDFGAGRAPEALAAVFEDAGVEHELLTTAGAAARWPRFRFADDGAGVLWHPAAGVIDAETAVAAMLRLARDGGARVETDWPVASVERAGAGHRVLSTDGRTEEAEAVVVTAGGWLPDLLGRLPLPEGFLAAIPPLRVMQENVYHFPYRDAPEEPWPTFIHKASSMLVYGLPGGRDGALPDGRAGLKVAEYNGGRPIRSAAVQNGEIDPANRERLIAYVRRTLPGLVPEPYAETTCLFTNTPTEDFVVDGAGGITVASPCSGHGAKFAPLIGRIVAEAASGERPPPKRFQVGAAGESLL
ncbi:FAD-dependent oxidoreductase [Actinomadura madurae]|uniref:Sarcosine oxidase n=1 Tax=Actinomadura madurae TaxID=1993 RepID=A0A1I5HFX3_9ACTN|nr:FAD-dependent oxidoreductase [Actinomadura madurae]SFO47155.1 sarcosine oxidase [Actinomadura madurae]SPT57731.1 N-methyl-L-tryptophan oxidase [Actinomadura madurae]